MIIRCRFRENLPRLSGTIQSRRFPRVIGKVDFVVDTGSNVTTLSEFEADRLHVPYNLLQRRPDAVGGIGGGQFAYELPEVEFRFIDVGQKPVRLQMPSILALSTETLGKRARRQAYDVSSVLGTDFLMANRLMLRVNPLGQACFIHSLEENP